MRSPAFFSILAVTIGSGAFVDDTSVLATIISRGGTVTIPAGDYHLDGNQPIPLRSNTHLSAHGARFILPATLPEKARLVLFAGENISHFTWEGGEFIGNVFDPAREHNNWEPSANTKGIEITTTRSGGTHDLHFRQIHARDMAGAVIGIHGLADRTHESGVKFYAERVALEECTLLRSGKFMWDYGYLWQIVTYPEGLDPWEVKRAFRYFRSDLLHDASILAGDDKVRVDNARQIFRRSASAEPKEALTFVGSELPPEITRGRQYFVIEATEGYARIAPEPGGAPIRFSRAGVCRVARDVFAH